MEVDGDPPRVTPGSVQLDNSGECVSMKWNYAVFESRSGVSIYAYDDSEQFQPVEIKHVKLKDGHHVQWSPLGSYLVCCRENDLIIVPNKPSSEKIKHPVDGEVCAAGISPQENFLYSVYISALDKDLAKMKIHDMDTREIRKSFDFTADLLKNPLRASICYPRFDNCDNYFALLNERLTLRIYETKTFADLQHLAVKHVSYFKWSPSAPTLALFADSYLTGNRRGCVRVVDVSTATVLHGFTDPGLHACKLIWQSDGNYLACLCMEKNSSHYSSVVLLSLKSRRIKPFRFGCKYKIFDFAWEGNGSRFAVSCSTNIEGENKVKEGEENTAVDFYSVQDGEEKDLRIKLLTLKNIPAHYLHWSPAGGHIVVQGQLRGPGKLQFYEAGEFKLLASVEFLAGEAGWDSSSRFFYAAAHHSQIFDDVVRIWSSCGEKVLDVGLVDLHFHWGNKLSPVAGSAIFKAEKSTADSCCERDGGRVGIKWQVDLSADARVSQRKISESDCA